MGLDSNGIAGNRTVPVTLGSLNEELIIECTPYSSALLTILGTFVGTISFYSSVDGSTYSAAYALDISGSPGGIIDSSSPDAFTRWQFNLSGITNLKVKMTSYTSGSADLTLVFSQEVTLLQGILSTVTTNGTAKLNDASGAPIVLGQASMASSVPVVISSDQSAIGVTVSSSSLPAGAATAALQTQPGVDIGDVTINNGVSTAAVNIQDGGNLISVDDGGFSITVDNAGTFATQAAQSGTWNITNVSGTVSLPTGAATAANQAIEIASLASIDAALPATLGQTTMANALAVTIASDQTAVPASQSGTWTVQPGNTANTTAWKVDGSAVTQPVSIASLTTANGALELNGNLAIQADMLQSILVELRAIRLAMTVLVCEGNRNKPDDFNPSLVDLDNPNFN